jgi:TonB family protein
MHVLSGAMVVATVMVPPPAAVAGENEVSTRLEILIGFPEAAGDSGDAVELTTGTVILLGEEGRLRHDDPVVERALAFARTVDKLWTTFRLDPERRKKYARFYVARRGETFTVQDVPETDVRISSTLMELTADSAIYRVKFIEGTSTLADSTVSVARGGRAVVGGMDGESAPYLFVVVEPSPVEDVQAIPFKMGGDLSEPRKIEGVIPAFPEAARANRVEGVVVLQTVIDEDGVVRDLEVLRSADPALDQAAAEAVRQWRFEPAKLADGTPVAVYYVLTIRFALQ